MDLKENGFGWVSRRTFLEEGKGGEWYKVGMHINRVGNEEGRGNSLGILLDI